MKRIYVEVSCDNCQQADYYGRPGVDGQAEKNGWIVVKRKHFCCQHCRAEYLTKDNQKE